MLLTYVAILVYSILESTMELSMTFIIPFVTSLNVKMKKRRNGNGKPGPKEPVGGETSHDIDHLIGLIHDWIVESRKHASNANLPDERQ
uniref:Uncharacterized protein n=1 Tax=Oryza glumipatula TaxID=40148 RepID=A0A0D9YLE5_9ORYZ